MGQVLHGCATTTHAVRTAITAIEGSAQGTSGAAWAEPQDSCQVA